MYIYIYHKIKHFLTLYFYNTGFSSKTNNLEIYFCLRSRTLHGRENMALHQRVSSVFHEEYVCFYGLMHHIHANKLWK